MDVSKLTDLELATHLNNLRKDFSLIVNNIQMLEAELNKRIAASKEKVESNSWATFWR